MSLISRMIRFAFIGALAFSSTMSIAQGTASPARKELVQRVLKLQQTGIESVGTGLANQTAGQFMQMAAQGLARVPEAKRQAVGTELQAAVRKFQDEATPILRANAVKWAPSTFGTSLEEKLSEDELKVLIAWLESPVSAKYQQVSAEALQALNQKMIADTRPQIEPKLKALEQTVAAKLKAAIATAPASPPAASGIPKK